GLGVRWLRVRDVSVIVYRDCAGAQRSGNLFAGFQPENVEDSAFELPPTQRPAADPRAQGVNRPHGCALLYPERLDSSEHLSYAETVGRSLVALGVLLVVIGLALEFVPRLPFQIGRLPGDIYFHRGNTTFYF